MFVGDLTSLASGSVAVFELCARDVSCADVLFVYRDETVAMLIYGASLSDNVQFVFSSQRARRVY